MKYAKKKKIAIWLTSILLVIALVAGGFTTYVSDYYRADKAAIQAFIKSNSNIKTTDDGRGMRTYGEENAECGFVFYPGGKVEYTAYEPLMISLASKGAFCVLLKMPFNLAVLDVNAAGGVFEKFPEISSWYIGGHSLGGSMAASYAKSNADRLEGVVLLAAYSTQDLSTTNLRVLSIFGSEDKVMNRVKYDECKANLPANFIEYKINGGCHAYFGMYGEQAGDGKPTIAVADQINKTSDYVTKFIKEGKK